MSERVTPRSDGAHDTLVEQIEHHLNTHVAPRACEIDRSPTALAAALDGLAARDWLALRRPPIHGGPGVDEVSFRRIQRAMARASGALAFLQTQHQSAVSMIAAGQNEALARSCLPRMGDGRLRVGIGYSQLRRPGPPAVRATPQRGGFRLDGVIPWVTGASFFSRVLVGATGPEGDAIFGMIPLSSIEAAGGRVTLGAPMALASMEVAQTVSVQLEGWVLPENAVVARHPAGWMRARDGMLNARKSFFVIGAARGALDVLALAAERRRDEAIKQAHARLHDALEQLESSLLAATETPEEWSSEVQLSLRAEAIALAGRCAHAAVTASGGGANMSNHNAQRVYREVLMFTVLAQTPEVRTASLEAIVDHQAAKRDESAPPFDPESRT